jgi:hypothetical protein
VVDKFVIIRVIRGLFSVFFGAFGGFIMLIADGWELFIKKSFRLIFDKKFIIIYVAIRVHTASVTLERVWNR